MYWEYMPEDPAFEPSVGELIEQLAPHAHSTEILCMAESREGGYRCTRHVYHDGRVHVAHDENGKPMAAWS